MSNHNQQPTGPPPQELAGQLELIDKFFLVKRGKGPDSFFERGWSVESIINRGTHGIQLIALTKPNEGTPGYSLVKEVDLEDLLAWNSVPKLAPEAE